MSVMTYAYFMSPNDKDIVWLHGEVGTPPFSLEARREAGFLMRQLQQGTKLSMPQSRPMPSIGRRSHELRITDEHAIWRIVNRTDSDAIVILDVFEKKRIQHQSILLIHVKKELGDMTMKAAKQKRLEAKGWKVGSAADFLELSEEEAAYIELKLKLASSLKEVRTRRHLTQKEFAKRIDSSQSRVAKMETGDRSVSLDLLIKSLLALGVTNKDIGKVITNNNKAA